jgi:hypothetical protein
VLTQAQYFIVLQSHNSIFSVALMTIKPETMHAERRGEFGESTPCSAPAQFAGMREVALAGEGNDAEEVELIDEGSCAHWRPLLKIEACAWVL